MELRGAILGTPFKAGVGPHFLEEKHPHGQNYHHNWH